ncbi:unnamed protein product [Oncorhynchus mykiss]|uniref:Uncharacterized protein n=1 Tax=Oncorhynchus mykiss TaxID=8022 RepID=A0A060WYM6_ONCMY|nr:unnamed protein product [Oncorhynchus mykiss]
MRSFISRADTFNSRLFLDNDDTSHSQSRTSAGGKDTEEEKAGRGYCSHPPTDSCQLRFDLTTSGDQPSAFLAVYFKWTQQRRCCSVWSVWRFTLGVRLY